MFKKAKKFIALALMSFLVSGCGGTPSPASDQDVEKTFTNPVWEPILADPTIIRDDNGTFYVYGTQDSAEWGEDFYGVSYLPILSSQDLVNWKYEDSVFKMFNAPMWGTQGAGLWAPDVVKIGDRYNVYYSLSTWGDLNPGIGVASASSPLGPFVDHGKILDSVDSNVGNSIDPGVNVEPDGRVYMTWGSFSGIYMVELTEDGLSVKGDPKDRILIAGVDGGPWNVSSYEGAYIRKINDYYYLFLSTGTCCAGHNSSYRVVVARSENIDGPYVDHAGVKMAGTLSRGSKVLDSNDEFVGVGHNSLIKDDAGDWWILYHGFDLREPERYGNTNRRSLLIDKLLWDENGWPYVEGYGASRGSDVPFIQT